MKLRTNHNSIRLRLSQTDVRTFAETGIVEEVVRTGPAPENAFSYRIVRSETAGGTVASFENSRLIVTVPAATADGWTGSDEVGIEASQPSGENSRLVILIEKDFACLTPRAGDDDKDTFPHPAASGKNC